MRVTGSADPRLRGKRARPPWPPVPQECYRRGHHGHLTTGEVGRRWRQSCARTASPPEGSLWVATRLVTRSEIL